MAAITVRNVDDRPVAALKARAKANGRSLEGKIRHLLARHAPHRASLEDFRERTARLAALTAGRAQTDSALLLREDRDR